MTNPTPSLRVSRIRPLTAHGLRGLPRFARNDGISIPKPRPHLPVRVIRRRRHHAHLVPACGQPGGHLARVLAYACVFGREVDAVKENLHGTDALRLSRQDREILLAARCVVQQTVSRWWTAVFSGSIVSTAMLATH